MATIKELLSAMIDKINGNEDKIDNIKGVPEAFDSITMTNGTDMANLTMSAEKELLFNGEAVGGGSGGVTSWNDLEDRPFYSEVSTIELSSENTYTVMSAMGTRVIAADNPTHLESFVAGDKYIVGWNDKTYSVVATEIDGFAGIDLKEENVEIAIVPSEPDVVTIVCPDLSIGDTVKFKLSTISETIHTIDPKYLPESGGVFIVNVTMDENGNLSIDKSVEEITKASIDNKVVAIFYIPEINEVESFDFVSSNGVEIVFNNVFLDITELKIKQLCITPDGITLDRNTIEFAS